MNNIDIYLESLYEGKTWDAVKKVWRDHKGKIIGAGLAAGAAYGIYKGAKAGAAYTKDVLDKNIRQKEAEKLNDEYNRKKNGPIATNAIKKKNKEIRMDMGIETGYVPPNERTSKMTPYVNKYKEKREEEKKERAPLFTKKYENPYKKSIEKTVEKRQEDKKNEMSYQEKIADRVKRSHEKRLELEKNKHK